MSSPSYICTYGRLGKGVLYSADSVSDTVPVCSDIQNAVLHEVSVTLMLPRGTLAEDLTGRVVFHSGLHRCFDTRRKAWCVPNKTA